MATNSVMRQVLCGQGLIRELVDYNLRRGTPIMRSDVRQLLCLLTKDNRLATEELNNFLTIRIVNAIKGHLSNTDFVSSSNLMCELQLSVNVKQVELDYEFLLKLISSINTILFFLLKSATVRHEMILLATTVQKEDSCWEQRVRCGMHYVTNKYLINFVLQKQ